MIGTTAKILLGMIVGAALLVAITLAICTDLFAPETRPALRGVRLRVARRPAIRSPREIPSQLVSRRQLLMEART
jgi:hypothetical protein